MKTQVKIIVIICILVFIGLVFNLFVKNYLLDNYGIETKATITKYASKDLFPNSGVGSNFMQYEYNVKGSKYIASKAIEIKDLKFPQSKNNVVGSKIQIVYLPVFPEINKVLYSTN